MGEDPLAGALQSGDERPYERAEARNFRCGSRNSRSPAPADTVIHRHCSSDWRSHTGAPEECIVTATGTSMANHLAMAAVLAPGDEVLIEQPAYGRSSTSRIISGRG